MEERVLVLDGNQRAALAAVRSLGSKQLEVAVGEITGSCLAGASRFCTERVVYADPYQNPRAFMDDIVRSVKRLSITFLLPITEATAYVVLKYRNELPASVVLPFPDTDSVDRVANKNELFRLALHKGVPVPNFLECSNISEGLRTLPSVTDFPIVLKPARSKIFLDQRIVTTQVVVANSLEEAEAALRSRPYFDHPFTIQSFVRGHGQGVFVLFERGEAIRFFAHRRLREKPPGGGVSVLSESTPVPGVLREHAENLLAPLKWHGVAMVEFRVAKDGTGYLMEVNPRFWGSLQLAIDSGVDFPWLLYLVSTGQPVPTSVWKHRKVRWLLGDLDRLYLVMKAPRSIYPLRKKLVELFRFFTPNLRTRHEVNRWNDMSPFWFELKTYLRALRK